MKTFEEYVEERFNIVMPKGNIPGSWFMANNLPMIVKCACCDMSMASPSVWIDEDGYVYCNDCANSVE